MPTGISVTVDDRNQHTNRKRALRELERRLKERQQEERAAARKARRDHAVHNETVIRTYDYKRATVTDHRTGKVASLKNVLVKGLIGLLR